MTLTTYRIDFPTPHGPCPEPLTVVAHRFDTTGAAIRYRLRKHLGENPAMLRYNMSAGTGSEHTELRIDERVVESAAGQTRILTAPAIIAARFAYGPHMPAEIQAIIDAHPKHEFTGYIEEWVEPGYRMLPRRYIVRDRKVVCVSAEWPAEQPQDDGDVRAVAEAAMSDVRLERLAGLAELPCTCQDADCGNFASALTAQEARELVAEAKRARAVLKARDAKAGEQR